jgi:anti-sigma B factor antagonist
MKMQCSKTAATMQTTASSRDHVLAFFTRRAPQPKTGSSMESNVKSETGYDLLQLSGEVDLHFSPKLRENILGSLKSGKPLLVDMAGVSYIDSSGIASLVEGFQTAKSAKLAFGLLNISQTAMQVLTLTRLDKIFSLYSSADQFRKQL